MGNVRNLSKLWEIMRRLNDCVEPAMTRFTGRAFQIGTIREVNCEFLDSKAITKESYNVWLDFKSAEKGN